jgi:hypothetical protein
LTWINYEGSVLFALLCLPRHLSGVTVFGRAGIADTGEYKSLRPVPIDDGQLKIEVSNSASPLDPR